MKLMTAFRLYASIIALSRWGTGTMTLSPGLKILIFCAAVSIIPCACSWSCFFASSILHTQARQGSCWQGQRATSLQRGPLWNQVIFSYFEIYLEQEKDGQKGFCRETLSLLLVILLVFVSLSLSFFSFEVKITVSGHPHHIVGLSNPRAKLAGPKGLHAESARAVAGRRCPHSGEGEDFLTCQPVFFMKTAITQE